MTGVVGILLAAGRGRRFGADKLLHPLADGEAVGIAAARHLMAAVGHGVAVVRAGDRPLAAALASTGLRVVANPRADAGIGTSIATGIAAAPDASGWLIALADMPWVRSATIATLAAALADGASLVAPAYRGRRGHPVGFAAGWRTELLALRSDQGARDLLATYPDALVLLPTDDPGVLRDVDRVSDLATQAEPLPAVRQAFAPAE